MRQWLLVILISIILRDGSDFSTGGVLEGYRILKWKSGERKLEREKKEMPSVIPSVQPFKSVFMAGHA